MTNITEIQQQINQAEAKVNELREILAAQKQGARTEAIASIKALIKEHALSASDLGLSAKKGAARKETSGNDKRSNVAPKYRDPATGKSWTGRGKSPTWLALKIAAGHRKEEFLIA